MSNIRKNSTRLWHILPDAKKKKKKRQNGIADYNTTIQQDWFTFERMLFM